MNLPALEETEIKDNEHVLVMYQALPCGCRLSHAYKTERAPEKCLSTAWISFGADILRYWADTRIAKHVCPKEGTSS